MYEYIDSLYIVWYILYIGNIEFETAQIEGVEGCKVVTKASTNSGTALRKCCELLNILPQALCHALTYRELHTTAPGELYHKYWHCLYMFYMYLMLIIYNCSIYYTVVYVYIYLLLNCLLFMMHINVHHYTGGKVDSYQIPQHCGQAVARRDAIAKVRGVVYSNTIQLLLKLCVVCGCLQSYFSILIYIYALHILLL